MKILFIADLHFVEYRSWQQFLKIDHDKFDIIVTLGDFDIIFIQSLQNNFKEKRILGVLGNHDCVGDLEYLNILDLHNKTVEIDKVTIAGIEGCVKYKYEKDTPIHTQEHIIDLCKTLKPADIIISHNSPNGIHDKPGLAHEGYYGLLDYIDKNNPKYCVHGHQHRCRLTKYENTYVVGVYGGIILDTINCNIENVLEIPE